MTQNPLQPMSVLAERMRAVVKGLDRRNEADQAAFDEIAKFAADIQEILDRANADLSLLEKRGDEIIQRYLQKIETRGVA
jgi:Mg2+ and Co2+ transporter CorA